MRDERQGDGIEGTQQRMGRMDGWDGMETGSKRSEAGKVGIVGWKRELGVL
jgi:hypothetical protein